MRRAEIARGLGKLVRVGGMDSFKDGECSLGAGPYCRFEASRDVIVCSSCR